MLVANISGQEGYAVPASGQLSGAIASPVAKPNQGVGRGAGVQVPAHIYQAVADASSRVGVSFAYLMDKAGTESSFNPNAQARTSSAAGLYQFIERTWLDMVDKHGEKYGLADYANAITRRRDGSLAVTDRETRQEILALRKDPRVAALMAAEYASENKQILEKNLGRPVGDTELYLAHFLGAGGATRFLKAYQRNPGASAAALLPEAASSNRNVFYRNSDGRALTLAQIYDRFDNKFSDAAVYVAQAPEGGSGFTDAARRETFAGQAQLADYRPQPGAVPGAAQPFLTTYLLAALEAPGEAERGSGGLGGLYRPAESSTLPQPAFAGFA